MKDDILYKGVHKKLESSEDDVVIDWVGILFKLIAIRKSILIAAILGILIGSIFVLGMPKQYTVNVTLSPEVGTNKTGGGLASMAASFLGASIGDASPDALNVTLTPNIISSTPFLLDLLSSEVITTNNKKMSLLRYLEQESLPWWNYLLNVPTLAVGKVKSLFSSETAAGIFAESKSRVLNLSKEQIVNLNKLRSLIFADIEKKTNITTIGVKLQDPRVAAMLADKMVTELQSYLINYKISKARDDEQYWETIYKERQTEYYQAQKEYADFVDANSNVISQKIVVERERLQNEMNIALQVYTQVGQQLQMAKAKVQEQKPVFAVIEPSIVPINPSSISRMLIIIIFVLFSICIAIFWQFYGKEYYATINNKLKKELSK